MAPFLYEKIPLTDYHFGNPSTGFSVEPFCILYDQEISLQRRPSMEEPLASSVKQLLAGSSGVDH